jgi:hypothetical protein
MGYRRGPDAAFRGQQAVASPLNQTVLSRAITDLNLAGEYAEAMLLGAQFPPAVVFGEAAGEYWLADGYHRWHAATIAGLQTIACDVRPGGRREAILHSVGANAEHGWRRSTEDKRRAVRTLLNDAEWCQWSDREIGRRCGVDHKTVAPLRPAPLSGEFPQMGGVRKAERNGTVYALNTAGINSDRRREVEIEPVPDYPLDADPRQLDIEDAAQADAEEAWQEMHRDDPPAAPAFVYDAAGAHLCSEVCALIERMTDPPPRRYG